MSVLASTILARVRFQLVDNSGTQRWTDAELLQWLSEGQRATVMAVPGASQTVATVPLIAGTKQTLPTGAHILLHIYRNLSSGGVAGQVCREVDRVMMDTQYPTWHTDAASAAALFYVYDRLYDPVAFYVYPKNDGTGSLEVNYSFMPIDVATTATNIGVRDIFQTALVDFILYKAHSKDSDYAAGQGAAAAYFQAFITEIGSQGGGKA